MQPVVYKANACWDNTYTSLLELGLRHGYKLTCTGHQMKDETKYPPSATSPTIEDRRTFIRSSCFHPKDQHSCFIATLAQNTFWSRWSESQHQLDDVGTQFLCLFRFTQCPISKENKTNKRRTRGMSEKRGKDNCCTAARERLCLRTFVPLAMKWGPSPNRDSQNVREHFRSVFVVIKESV